MNSQGATEFEPSIEWVNEDDCDTLLLYLPGFAKEQLKVQLRSRTLIISGQRRLHDNTWTRFRKEYPLPEHCEVSKISAKFEGNILYVKQPKSTPRVAKQEEKLPTNAPAPTPTPEKLTDETKALQEQAQEKPESKPASMTQPDGQYGADKSAKDSPLEEKDGKSEERVGELKERQGVCENASKKMAGGSDMVTRLKFSRNDLIKVLAFVVGFVVGLYCTKSIQSLIA